MPIAAPIYGAVEAAHSGYPRLRMSQRRLYLRPLETDQPDVGNGSYCLSLHPCLVFTSLATKPVGSRGYRRHAFWRGWNPVFLCACWIPALPAFAGLG